MFVFVLYKVKSFRIQISYYMKKEKVTIKKRKEEKAAETTAIEKSCVILKKNHGYNRKLSVQFCALASLLLL